VTLFLPSEKAALTSRANLRRQHREILRIEGLEGVIEEEADRDLAGG
jgi:hypothetical protein